MYLEQLYTGCLAEAAYYIESNGEAAIIDPLRETEPYLELATKRGAKIKYIFETHFHADFVSGHVDLAQKTRAQIVYGPTANTDYKILEAKDGQVFKIGDLKLKVLHTPGHTPESSCYLLFDENGREEAIFTGDTLFIGDVGRPDLAQKSGEITAEDMAATLYDSLRSKIMPLPDHITVYPGHGAGSACGKKMSSETSALLGEQKQTNYALDDLTKEEFVKELTTGILPPPQYFAKAAAQNKKGYKSIDQVFESSLNAMSVEQVQTEIKNVSLIIDTRHRDDFRDGHIVNSWFIGLNGQFAPWAGALIEDLHQKIIIVAEAGKEEARAVASPRATEARCARPSTAHSRLALAPSTIVGSRSMPTVSCPVRAPSMRKPPVPVMASSKTPPREPLARLTAVRARYGSRLTGRKNGRSPARRAPTPSPVERGTSHPHPT